MLRRAGPLEAHHYVVGADLAGLLLPACGQCLGQLGGRVLAEVTTARALRVEPQDSDFDRDARHGSSRNIGLAARWSVRLLRVRAARDGQGCERPTPAARIAGTS